MAQGLKRPSKGGSRLEDGQSQDLCTATHVTFPRDLGLLIRTEAKARNLSVTAFVQLAMESLLEAPELLAAIDGAASYRASRKGQLRGADGLTQNQRAILYLAATHAGIDGRCRMGPKGFAALTAMASTTAMSALLKLERAALIVVMKEARHLPVQWVELTPDGWAAARALTGIELKGGVA